MDIESVVIVIFYGLMKTAIVYDMSMVHVVLGAGVIVTITTIAASKLGLFSSYQKRSTVERVFDGVADIVIFIAWIYIYIFTDNRSTTLVVKAAQIILFAYAAALADLTFRNRKDYLYYVYLGICIALLITCFTDSYAEFHGEVYEGL